MKEKSLTQRMEEFEMPTDINDMEQEYFHNYLTKVLEVKYDNKSRASSEAERAISNSVTADGIIPNEIVVRRALNGSYKQIGDISYVMR